LLDGEQHAMADSAALVPPEIFRLNRQQGLYPDYAVAADGPGPKLVKHRPQSLASKPKPNLSDRNELAVSLFGNLKGFEPARPEFLKPG
jgi:hypothetical protein